MSANIREDYEMYGEMNVYLKVEADGNNIKYIK